MNSKLDDIHAYGYTVKGKPQGLREKSFPRRALIGPCGTLIAIVVLIALIVLLVIIVPMDRREGYAGDTVYLDTAGDNFWTWAFGFNEEIYTDPLASPHLSDIYLIPTENVKVYSTEKVFSSRNVFQANSSRSSAKILYLYQIESLVYEVTASSGNATTTDGKLYIFNDHDDYYYYVGGDGTYISNTVLHKSFPIGNNNTPITTVVTFNQSSITHSYYYLACTTPSNITISFNATVKMWYYDYKDYGQKNCSIKQNAKGTNTCAIYFTPSGPYTALAHVNPNDVPDKPITILDVEYRRVLPPPVLLVAVGALLLAVVPLIMYLKSWVSS